MDTSGTEVETGSSVAYDPRSSTCLVEPMSAQDNASLIHLGSDVDPRPSSTEDLAYTDGPDSHRADTVARLGTDGAIRGTNMDGDPTILIHRSDDDPMSSRLHTDDPMGMIQRGVAPMGMIPLNDEDPELPPGNAELSSSSSLYDSRASSVERGDDDVLVQVKQTKKAKKAKKKAKVKVRPNPPGFTLSNDKFLQRLRKKCGFSEEIM
ncbi:hypothetical protein AALP_AAs55885U000100 [Arabis alpina]|uniref:Uncharacterized protein n=1 Tax=Arabis alpina TaxID=50452 RepID=A0A087FY66_ARAAL|nr:hypothetical protein AALP_AAs55885U000100 [Arabis alpina]